MDPHTKRCRQTQKDADRINTFERKILRRIYGPIKYNNQWRSRYNAELYELYKKPDLVTDVKLRR